ncbi:glycosyl transferase [Massilia sp. WF1]|uniref:glycosyltransferase family 4 protein n=1 Tax=unclassified Massilia TaxID=2609279 RepID=UPI00064A2854|nr:MULTISPECIES: glycosyltransferase family 4 protein [unclassified Massilia]ALK96696.1 glycosyl transferase [Massilia sp. WG5]KLU38039.1 glycosyl transferase [Massilia sp. WF1]
MSRIVHLTSAHPRNDTRIFIKQCRSLAAHGYDVTLVVADDKGDEVREGVTIADVGRLPGRFRRIFTTTRRVADKAAALDADLYHLHDPELIPAGLRLKRMGKKVIFDSHEDVPRQLLSKPYLGPVSGRVLSNAFAMFERYACARFDGIIAATPFIRNKFLKINRNTVDVNNFPMAGELDSAAPWENKRHEVCYVGGIGAVRGIREVVRAGEFLQSDARLNLVGTFSEAAVEAEVKAGPGWARVNACGFLDRQGVRDVLQRSLAGVVTFLPLPNHLDSLPTKMFEYMSSGIPVIASDFPLWREIIEGNRCGMCVDPLDPRALAAAIDYLVAHPDIAKSMGENGRKAVLEKYNWTVQAKRLTDFYGAISHVKQTAAAA